MVLEGRTHDKGEDSLSTRKGVFRHLNYTEQGFATLLYYLDPADVPKLHSEILTQIRVREVLLSSGLTTPKEGDFGTQDGHGGSEW